MFVKRKTVWITLAFSLFLCGAFTLPEQVHILKPELWSLARLDENQGAGDALSRVFIPVTQITVLDPFEKEGSDLWLKQEFRLPDEWAGQSVVLSGDYPLTDADIYINGESSGHITKGKPFSIPLKKDLLKFNRFNTLLIRLEEGRGFYGSINLFNEPVGIVQRLKAPIVYYYLPWGFAGIALLAVLFSLISIIRRKIPVRSIPLFLYSLLFLAFTVWKYSSLWRELVPLVLPPLPFVLDSRLILFISAALTVFLYFLCLKKGRFFFILSLLAGGGVLFLLSFPEHPWLSRIPWADSIPYIPSETAVLFFAFISAVLMFFAFIADMAQQKRMRFSFLLGFCGLGALLIPDIFSFLAWGSTPFSFYLYLSGIVPFFLLFLRKREAGKMKEQVEQILSPENMQEKQGEPEMSSPAVSPQHVYPEPQRPTRVRTEVSTGQMEEISLLQGLVNESYPDPFFMGTLWDIGVCSRFHDHFSSHFYDYVTDSGRRLEAGCFLNLGAKDQYSGLLTVSLKGKVKDLMQSGHSLSETARDMDAYISQAYKGKASQIPSINGAFFRFSAGYVELTPVNSLPVLYRNGRTGKVTVIRLPGNSRTLGKGFGSEKGIKSIKMSASGGDQFLLLHPSLLEIASLSEIAALFKKVNIRDIISVVQTLAVQLDRENTSELFFMILQARNPVA